MNPLPSRAQILDWIADNPDHASRRDIAKAFGIRGAGRHELARILDEIGAHGHPPAGLRDRRARTAGGQTGGARAIRRIAAAPQRVLGIFRTGPEGGRIVPVERKASHEWRVASADARGARDGELVEAEDLGRAHRFGLPHARVTARLGDPTAPKAVSLIAIHQFGIPHEFAPEALAEAEAEAAHAFDPARDMAAREDLRALPFVTIDPDDARDHDDAVFAAPDDDPANEGGHIVWVAIADVAHHVRSGSALDRAAYERGNSTYFPDRVVPMLPERLSGDLCSLHEGETRPVIAARMVIDARGNKLSHRFARAVISAHATLSYDEVQAAHDGRPNERCAPLLAPVIAPLYAAFEALMAARALRQPLDLDLPERRIRLSEDGHVTSVSFVERLDAHRLIEEFMILANVAAAEDLSGRRAPLLFRVHEEPAPEKLEALREVAQASGLVLAKGTVLRTAHLNRLLAEAEGTDSDELINYATLRAMQQAYYSPQNFGHFGLALKAYAHFTSPIRRYADLVVHRALIAAHRWGPDPARDGLSAEETAHLDETAQHISQTERRSMRAEQETNDRYLASYLSEQVGLEMGARVSGVQRFGCFVRLDETGADGLIPVRTLGREYFRLDEGAQTLTGEESGLRLRTGDRVTVRLSEAAPVTGGLIFELIAVEGKTRPPPRKPGKGSPRRKVAAAERKIAKLAKKAARTRGNRGN